MHCRQAILKDIPQLQEIRNAVKENSLSDPGLVTTGDYELYLTQKGKGWVLESAGQILGFAIVDVQANNIWALFVRPGFEGKGVGKELHQQMMDWYFSETRKKVWLSTSPGTRAAAFYKQAGWQQNGLYGKGELKFEMSYEQWLNNRL